MNSIPKNPTAARTAINMAKSLTKSDDAGAKVQAEAKPKGTPMTALEQHVSFFENLTKGGGVVDAKTTRSGLSALGLGTISAGFGGHALTVPFAIPQNADNGVLAKVRAGVTGELALDRIHEGVRGVDEKSGQRADSGIYDKEGNIDSKAFMTVWTEFAGDKGFLNDDDIVSLVENKVVNALEFGLLMELGGQISTEGERVLTPEAMISFYDGSLFNDLAEARDKGVLLEPTNVLQHDGAKEIAKSLSSMALQNGGAAAGEAGKALYGAKMTIDVDASLAYQQKDKSLGPTIKLAGGTALKGMDSELAQNIGSSLAGTFKAMCPAGKG